MNQSQHNEDEINLYELWNILTTYKLLILAITTIITLGAAIYIQRAAPIYHGKVLIEVGKIVLNSSLSNNKPIIIQTIEPLNDFIEVLTENYATTSSNKLTFTSSSQDGTLLHIQYESNNKKNIQDKLQHIIEFTLKRHQQKEAFFKKINAVIYPTAIASEIHISKNSIKSSKQLIISIAFFSGLILSLFLIFLIESLTKIRNRTFR